jgi:hypothetical protein
MKVAEGRRVMIRDARLSGMALHLGWPPVEARPEAPPRRVALVRGFVLVHFLVVTPWQVVAAVGLAQILRLAVAPLARLPAARVAANLTAASQ